MNAPHLTPADGPVETVAYLGPRGTFTEIAMRSLAPDAADHAIALPTVDAVLDAVRSGRVTSGVVPIENSLEGPVTPTIDSLSRSDAPLVIVGEWALPVQFALLGRAGTELGDIRRVTTIPIAAAQCRQWLDAHVPGAHIVAALSTAHAAQRVAEDDPPAADAAISAAIAAEHYGLEVLATNIGDNPDASTRFVHVRPPTAPPERTGADKTSLVLFMREDHAGALQEILTEFAVRGVNLTRIESRPTRRQLGDYYFSIDCEGHIADARVAEALMGLSRVCADVRYLGSYPRHDGKETHVRPGTTDADFTQAAAWLRQMREGPG